MKARTVRTAADIGRRRFLRAAGAAAAWAAIPARVRAAPSAKLLDTRIISHDDAYHGWPTLARRANGDLLLVCSGGREGHICPFGRVDLMVSKDHGATWGYPRVLLDSDTDDRDAGVLETAKGTLLVTTFTSQAYEPYLAKAAARPAGDPAAWPAEKLARWNAAHTRLDADGRKAELGTWMIRSTDGGRTWSPRYDSIVNSPHGPAQLADGRLLYAGKKLWADPKRVGVCESRDDGATWTWLAEIPARPGDDFGAYHELHAVEAAPGGRIVVQIRNHNKTDAQETIQTESDDGGRTWSVPHAIGVWGLPSHLLRLRDGRLLMTYGHRRAPLGNQARVSADGGRTWSGAIPVSADGTSSDLGYPSTVELADGTLLTAWYETVKGRDRAVLRQAAWTLEA